MTCHELRHTAPISNADRSNGDLSAHTPMMAQYLGVTFSSFAGGDLDAFLLASDPSWPVFLNSLVDHVIPHIPVRQWVLSLPIPKRVLLAAQPALVTPVLQVVQRVITRYLLAGARLKADEGHGGAVTLIQRFGSAANLNIHLHCLVLDGVYQCHADGAPAFVEAGTPTDGELHALLRRYTPSSTWQCSRAGAQHARAVCRPHRA